MKTMNTAQVAELLGIKEETLLKTIKRYNERLTNLGCIFTTTGKGRNTIYTFTHISKGAADMQLIKKWEETFGFKPKRPYMAISYYRFLLTETRATTMSDAEAAFAITGTKEMRTVITMARQDLEKAGFIKPLKASETVYRLTIPNGTEPQIVEKGDYDAAWFYFFERLGFNADEIAKWDIAAGMGLVKETDPETQKAAGQIAWEEMKEEWGTPSKIKKRELTGKGTN